MARYRSFFLVAILAVGALSAYAQDRQVATIVFVCKHGSAKSVIAAAHFNHIAEAQGLPYRAISRGVQSDAEIPTSIKTAVSADGLDVSGWKPKTISDDDVRRAERVVTLSCQLPKFKSLDATKTIDWPNLPPVSNGYEEARAAIVDRINDLLRTLSKKR